MRTFAFLLALLLPAAAFGQLEDFTLIGAGVRSRPDYDGSPSRTIDLIPVIRYYGKPLFARTTQGILEGGARMTLGGGVTGGVQLAYEAGPRDKDPGPSAGFHFEWDGKLGEAPVDVIFRTRYYLDTERGIQYDLRGNIGVFRGGGTLLGLFTQFTFANGENTRAYFGVDDAGYLYTDVGAWGMFDLARNWVLLGNVHVRVLNSDIARRSLFGNDRTGLFASAAVAYRF